MNTEQEQTRGEMDGSWYRCVNTVDALNTNKHVANNVHVKYSSTLHSSDTNRTALYWLYFPIEAWLYVILEGSLTFVQTDGKAR
jgi:hypothetical protein